MPINSRTFSPTPKYSTSCNVRCVFNTSILACNVHLITSHYKRRASYFSPTPTDKMYAVVAAAKALYEQLGRMGDTSINGDSFLDLWIYVIIKANVRDLVSSIPDDNNSLFVFLLCLCISLKFCFDTR